MLCVACSFWFCFAGNSKNLGKIASLKSYQFINKFAILFVSSLVQNKNVQFTIYTTEIMWFEQGFSTFGPFVFFITPDVKAWVKWVSEDLLQNT